MSAFILTLMEPNQEVLDLINEKYPNRYVFNETTIFLSSDEISENIAISIGLKGKNRIEDSSGAVIALRGTYSGYTSKALWEWLKKNESSF